MRYLIPLLLLAIIFVGVVVAGYVYSEKNRLAAKEARRVNEIKNGPYTPEDIKVLIASGLTVPEIEANIALGRELHR